MTPIIKRLELAEAALLKNGFVLVDDVWAAPAIQQEDLRETLIDLANTQRKLMEANAELAAIHLNESSIQQEGAALDERIAQIVEWLIGQGHMDWRSDGADESGHEDCFNSNAEEAATLRHYVGKASAALAPLPAQPKPPADAAHNSQDPNCSCPSGNGSLRWPCLVHPPADAAPVDAKPVALLAALEKQVMRLNEWRLCMSHNDSYFSEPKGLVKSCVEEMEFLFRSYHHQPKPPADAALTLEQIQDAAAVFKHALVPLHVTRAMQEVMDDEGWAWEDVLGAAAAITDEQYSEIQAAVQQGSERDVGPAP